MQTAWGWMRFVDVIARKRDGLALSREDIERFVAGATDGSVPDYQLSALLMAIVLRGMAAEEAAWLTGAMLRSGDRLDLSMVPGPKVGKHSTGGVGDKVSIVLGPLAAACGVVVPKLSGRGLGYTGGTIDKLESIPGFRADLDVPAFIAALSDVGVCITGQTATLAPADKALYALRDVTATVESVPLIAASIMSKKLAEGCGALLLDVKCGRGAFMKDLLQARALASAMVAIGSGAGVRTEASITAMDAPLGRTVGNALEVVEAIGTLRGGGPADLTELAVHAASVMVQLAGIEAARADADRRVRAALARGDALDRLRRMVAAQGGDPCVVDEPARLPQAPDRHLVRADRGGVIQGIDAASIGRASHLLGGGRARAGDAIDHAVGVVVHAGIGDRVRVGEAVLELHHRGGRGLPEAVRCCGEALVIGDTRPASHPMVLDEIR